MATMLLRNTLHTLVENCYSVNMHHLRNTNTVRIATRVKRLCNCFASNRIGRNIFRR